MLPLLKREACLVAAIVFVGACGSEPGVPTTLALSAVSLSFTALGETQQLTPSVSDQQGDALAGAAVSWSSSNNAVATVSQTGLVTAVGTGAAEVTATSGAAAATAEVSVVQSPAQLIKISGDSQTVTAGDILGNPLVVEAADALGNPVAGTMVIFAVLDGGGSVGPTGVATSATGRASSALTTGPVAGAPQEVSAAIAATSISVAFTATTTAGVPASISPAAGANQHALPGTAVPVAPAVTIRDANDNPVSGVAVEFEVVHGGGSITESSGVTNANGQAEVGSWTLGADNPNQLRATAAGTDISGNPVTFTAATTGSAFNIEVRFLTGATAAQAQVFTEAERKWENLIVGDLPNLVLNEAAGSCDNGTPALDETVDDVIIFATIGPIDGAGGVLGQAGPCFVRDRSLLPVIGVMFFDSEDLDFVEGQGLLQDLIVHEMGHVLGFGTLWPAPYLNLLVDPAAMGGSDPHFIGPQAIASFDVAGGTTYTGAKVPAENLGGPGTVDSHWRESVFDNELMTGFVNLDANPLSAVTVAALADQGYSVDLSRADPYTLTAALRVPEPRPRLHLTNDVRRLPVKVLDREGRPTRVYRR